MQQDGEKVNLLSNKVNILLFRSKLRRENESFLLNFQVYACVGHPLYVALIKIYRLSISQEDNDAADTNSNARSVCEKMLPSQGMRSCCSKEQNTYDEVSLDLGDSQ